MHASKPGTLTVLRALLALSSAGLLPAVAAAVVVPGSLELVDGNADNCVPLTGCLDRDRYQQVFDASEFSGPIVISEIRFRRDAPASPSTFSTSFTAVTVRLSTTSAGPDSLSTTFASNQGSDLATVHTGALTLSSPSSGGDPAPFDVSLVLDDPFPYDPAEGNLLMDWINFGGESFGSVFYDAVNVAGDPVSRVIATAPGAATGSADSVGLVVEFVGIDGDHPCCETGGIGCNDPVIQLEVCSADDFCCENEWDQLCVEEVTTIARQSCNACVDRDTPSARHPGIRACVCAADPYCCTTRWDNICVGEVASLGCGSCANQEFVYVHDEGPTGSPTTAVSGFAVEPGAGAIPGGFLTPIFASPYSTGETANPFEPEGSGAIAATQDRACVFATNSGASTVSSFQRIDGGGLVLAGSQLAGNPISVAVDDLHRLVFVLNKTGLSLISVYSFDASCALTPKAIPIPSMPPGQQWDLEVSRDGSTLFVSHGLIGTISALDVGPGGSSLTHVPGSPYSSGGLPTGLALSSDGSNLYSCDTLSMSTGGISGFDTDALGVLTPMPGSPFATSSQPFAALVSKGGDHLVVSSGGGVFGSDELEVFDIAPDGSLSPVGTLASSGWGGLATNESGQQIFAVLASGVSVYDLDSTGSLTEIAGSPFVVADAGVPISIAYVPEPGAVSMLVAGVTTLLGLARRRAIRRST